MRIPIHREGWPFIGLFFAANVLLFLISAWIGWAFVPLTLWCVAFFRDPERVTPRGEGLLTSPADGVLLPVAKAVPPPELGMGPEPRVRLSVFMNVFDVHVNRFPVSGEVDIVHYNPGEFVTASLDKASLVNEQASVGIVGPRGRVLVRQIAGLIARRIVTDVAPGDAAVQGERFGMIRFGSRVDVFLQTAAAVRVAPGQPVRAGQTVLAEYPA